MNRLICIIFSFCLLSGCTDLETVPYTESAEDYKLLHDYGTTTLYWVKKNLINYFVSVALGTEYGPGFKISRKWHSDMRLFVEGSDFEDLLEELDQIILDINELTTDEFQITLVDHKSEANFIAFIGTKKDYNKAYPGASEIVNENDGIFRIEMDDFEIIGGSLFVNSELLFLDLKKHLLREELTQSLGFGNDIPYYPNSIFYEQPSRVTSYNINDKEIIRLLYHPQMIAGLSESTVRSVMGDILGVD